jgi:serine phosphatase RsbU (regulator of sigma subunit)
MFGTGLTAAATAVRLVRPVLTLGLAGVPLGRVMEVLNSDLRREDELSMASLMLVKFEPLSGELRYASAGHLPPILLKRDAKKPHLLSGNGGPALGLIEDAKFTEFSAELGPGDAVVGFTDGVVDRRQTNPLANLAARFLKGYREGGPEGLLSLPLPQVADEACVCVLQVED